MSTRTLLDPFSASSKGWSHPDFSLEGRKRKVESYSFPSLEFSPTAPPDEEKGRKFSSTSSTSSLSFSPATCLAPSLLPATASSSRPPELKSAASWLRNLAHEDEEEEQREFMEGEALEEGLQLSPSSRVEESPEAKWSAAISHAVTFAKGEVDMSGQHLTSIPEAINDLTRIVKLQSSSPATIPSRALRSWGRNTQSGPLPFDQPPSTPPRPFTRSTSGSLDPSPRTPSTPVASVPLNLTLSNNSLTAQAIAPLFALDNLRILTLRKNNLERLPEAVVRLQNLATLNIGSNQIDYLPSEILQLDSLTQLFLHPNPFLPPPTTPSSTTRLLGPLTTHFLLPSLREICHRILLAPTSTSSKPLITTLDSPELRDYLSPYPHLASPFLSSLSRPSAPAGAAAVHPSSNVCCSPRHGIEGRRFVKCAVERIEWVMERNLKKGGEGPETRIPVRWRGCEVGCLDWLEE